jgi:hypothetical protein
VDQRCGDEGKKWWRRRRRREDHSESPLLNMYLYT